MLVPGKIKHFNPCGPMQIEPAKLVVLISGKDEHNGLAGKTKTL
jgi:hypothetical protein